MNESMNEWVLENKVRKISVLFLVLLCKHHNYIIIILFIFKTTFNTYRNIVAGHSIHFLNFTSHFVPLTLSICIPPEWLVWLDTVHNSHRKSSSWLVLWVPVDDNLDY